MASLVAVGHIFGTALLQTGATILAHGAAVSTVGHLANIGVATVGWLSSGAVGTGVLAAGAGVLAGITKGVSMIKNITGY